MQRSIGWAIAVLILATSSGAAPAASYTIKQAVIAAPKEVQAPIAGLLSDQAVQFFDAKGSLLAEWWFRKELPSKATAAQVQKGLNYRDLDETTVLGAVRFPQPAADYRKQKIKPGVYTIRLGFQPMDGDHMGTAPYSEFGLLVPAAADAKPETMDPKELQELSNKAATGNHPAVFLLVPNGKPEPEPQLMSKGKNWVLNWQEVVQASGQKANLGIGLTVVGHAD
jgi:hypothetical protein